LRNQAKVPVYVGNISAASWSFPNQLAYLREYGVFDADAAVIIMNKVDMYDYPSFQPLDRAVQPQKPYPLAIMELYSKYLKPRLAPYLNLSVYTEKFGAIPDGRTHLSLELTDMLKLLQSQDVTCYLAYHPSADELDATGKFSPATDSLNLVREVAIDQNVELLNLASGYGESIRNGGSPLRDLYHPSADGQALIADQILAMLIKSGQLDEWKKREPEQ